ncbi:MFS transporter [Cellvibrio sp. KY-GH-1]|uniref:MFS transporter n=1 Tax=Cellvibrio sp. KY-GH-1 TaxID=2303332 RepID=UPI00124669A5|nr:MFS transporter [Cellvibrio sp. KY-GH-1]QEY18206.1 MFS transporter [Cellvibrio sp. KY-GH-1]
MNSKPQLSFWQIWNLCFGFFGIQFGFALQNANVSRIFQILGAPIEEIPILWVAAPLTGLLIQPVIGYMSDKTWSRVGRRRPYVLCGAIAATLALLVMPNSPELWIAAGMLWVLDASLNIALAPSIAMLGDTLPKEQRAQGFSMQSFFIGVSAVVASALPWILNNWLGVANTAPVGEVPPSVTYAFYAGATILLLSLCWSAWKTTEYSPAQLARFEQWRNAQQTDEEEKNYPGFHRNGCWFFVAGIVLTALILSAGFDYKLLILALGIALFGVLQIIAGALQLRNLHHNPVYQITRDIVLMPRVMRQLALVQCLSWFALFSMWIYTTAAVTSHHYHSTDPTSPTYNEGADWVGVLFAAYNGFAALAALAIPQIVRRTNRKITHMINLCLGALGFISFLWIRDPHWLLLAMLGVGFAWASILALPLAILTSALPPTKMGVYAGIYNFFIVIPQILASSILALVVSHWFDGQPVYALVCAGAFLLLAAIATAFVDDHHA